MKDARRSKLYIFRVKLSHESERFVLILVGKHDPIVNVYTSFSEAQSYTLSLINIHEVKSVLSKEHLYRELDELKKTDIRLHGLDLSRIERRMSA